MKYSLQPHIYQGDGIPDEDGNDRCIQARCGYPQRHPIHKLREVSGDERQAELRRLGERED